MEIQQYAPPPPKQKIIQNFYLFNLVEFQESNYSSQLFDLSLFKDIYHVFKTDVDILLGYIYIYREQVPIILE